MAAIPALALEHPFDLTLPQTALLATVYYAVIPTVGGFLLWYAGTARVSGSEASLFTAVAPVSAVFMAWFALGETIAFTHVIGVGCVLVAVLSVVLMNPAPVRSASPTEST